MFRLCGALCKYLSRVVCGVVETQTGERDERAEGGSGRTEPPQRQRSAQPQPTTKRQDPVVRGAERERDQKSVCVSVCECVDLLCSQGLTVKELCI